MGKGRRASGTRPRKRRDYRVFMSHATADKWLATVICEKLEVRGIVTFRDDRDIRGGDDIPLEIQREIARCDEVLVLLSPQSVVRVWVILEVGMALARNRRIIPILYHVSIDPIPTMIQSRKAYDLNEIEKCFVEVAERRARKAKKW